MNAAVATKERPKAASAPDMRLTVDRSELLKALGHAAAIVERRQSDVQSLAEAIRCGERERAEMFLDAIIGVLPGAVELREWVDRGRYSKRAREAVRRPAETPRKAA